MTDAIYSWMRNLAYYYLFYSIIMNILPDNQYRAYVKNFMGMLLIILLIGPILSFFKVDGELDAKIRMEEFTKEYDKAVNGQMVMEENNHDYLVYAYEQEMESQITQLFEKHDLYVWDIRISLEGEEKMTVNRIYVLAGKQPDTMVNRVEEIIIQPDSEKQEVVNLKKELQEVYHTDTANIIINIQE